MIRSLSNNLFTVLILLFFIDYSLLFAQSSSGKGNLFSVLQRMRDGMYEESLRVLNSQDTACIEQYPQEYRYVRSICLHNLKDHEAGRKLMSTIVNDFGSGENASYSTVIVAALAAARLKDKQGAIDLVSRVLSSHTLDASSRKRSFLYSLRGTILLNGHQREEAVEDFHMALKLCEQNLQALSGLVTAAFENKDYGAALKLSQSAFQVAQTVPEDLPFSQEILSYESMAEILYRKGMIHLQENDLTSVRDVEKRFSTGTFAGIDHPLAIGLSCALAYVEGNEERLTQKRKRAAKICPGSFIPLLSIGKAALASRQGVEAEKYLRLALEADVRSAESYWMLGELLLRDGRIEEARENLNRAFLCDSSLQSALNYVSVVDYMAENYLFTSKGNDFLLKVPKEQFYLIPLVRIFIENSMDAFQSRYSFSHRKPVVVEIHQDTEKLALRATALPWLPVRGVCFGRVVTVLSSEKSPTPFSIKSVIRHEMSHSYTLGKTKGRIPRWLTEGLAQIDEDRSRPEEYARSFKLFGNLRQLPSLRTLDTVFLRPRHIFEVGAAYYQSWLLTTWIIQNRGFNAIVSLLDDLGSGKVHPFQVFDELGIRENEQKNIEKYIYDHSDSLTLQPAFTPDILLEKSIFTKDGFESQSENAFPGDAVEKGASIFRIRTLLSSGKDNGREAFREVKRQMRKEKTSALYALAGEIAYRNNRLLRAEELFETAIKQGDSTADTLLFYSLTLARNQNEERARKVLESGLPGTYPLNAAWKFLYVLTMKSEGLSPEKPLPSGSKTIAVLKKYCSQCNDEFSWFKMLSESTSADESLKYALEAAAIQPDFTVKAIANLEKTEHGIFSFQDPDNQAFLKAPSGKVFSAGIHSLLNVSGSFLDWFEASFETFSPSQQKLLRAAVSTVYLNDKGVDVSLIRKLKDDLAGKDSALLIQDQMAQAGYDYSNRSLIPKAAVLILALDDERWFVRFRAARILMNLKGTSAYKYALWLPLSQKKEYNYREITRFSAYSELSREVSSYWQDWLKDQL